jgi:hypothetical protein
MVLVLAPLQKNTISNVLWFLPTNLSQEQGVKVEQLKMNMQEFKAKWPINTLFIEIPQCDVLKKTDTPKKNEIGS